MIRNLDRKRIYQEEVYRHEVRARLDKTDQKKNKVGGKIWTFINSAFFLWFLSSVVLGIISFSYAKWDKQKGLERDQREREALIEREKIQRIRKLDAEISSRLIYFVLSQNIYLVDKIVVVETVTGEGSLKESEVKKRESEVKEEIENTPTIEGLLSEEGIMSLNNPNAIDYKLSDPEYANRPLRSLLLELEEVVTDQEKIEIAFAYKQSTESQILFLNTLKTIRELKNKGKPDHIDIATVLKKKEWSKLKEFCQSFNLKRWGEPISVEGSRIINIEYEIR